MRFGCGLVNDATGLDWPIRDSHRGGNPARDCRSATGNRLERFTAANALFNQLPADCDCHRRDDFLDGDIGSSRSHGIVHDHFSRLSSG